MLLKEEQAKLILERHEHAEREAKLKVLQSKNAQLIEENNSLSLRVKEITICFFRILFILLF